MKVKSYQMQDYRLTDKQWIECRETAVSSMTCGVELEGQSQHVMPRTVCNFDRGICGICSHRGQTVMPAPETCGCYSCVHVPHQSGNEVDPETQLYCWSFCTSHSMDQRYCRIRQARAELDYGGGENIDEPTEDERWNNCFGCMRDNNHASRYGACDWCRVCSDCPVCDDTHCTNVIRGSNVTPQGSVVRVANKANCSRLKGADREDKDSDFLWAYADGSVDTELVTKPFKLPRLLTAMRKGIEIFKEENIIMSPTVRAGCHQTFCFDKPFPDIVARNTVQLLRYFYPALLSYACVKGTEGRSCNYRKLPERPGWTEKALKFNQKYEACHIKSDHAINYQPRMIEFRYPDMHQYVKMHIAVACLNWAIILQAIDMSRQGVAMFGNIHWEYSNAASHMIMTTGEYDDGINELRTELSKCLQPVMGMFLRNSGSMLARLNKWKMPVSIEDMKEFESFEFKWLPSLVEAQQEDMREPTEALEEAAVHSDTHINGDWSEPLTIATGSEHDAQARRMNDIRERSVHGGHVTMTERAQLGEWDREFAGENERLTVEVGARQFGRTEELRLRRIHARVMNSELVMDEELNYYNEAISHGWTWQDAPRNDPIDHSPR